MRGLVLILTVAVIALALFAVYVTVRVVQRRRAIRRRLDMDLSDAVSALTRIRSETAAQAIAGPALYDPAVVHALAQEALVNLEGDTE